MYTYLEKVTNKEYNVHEIINDKNGWRFLPKNYDISDKSTFTDIDEIDIGEAIALNHNITLEEFNKMDISYSGFDIMSGIILNFLNNNPNSFVIDVDSNFHEIMLKTDAYVYIDDIYKVIEPKYRDIITIDDILKQLGVTERNKILTLDMFDEEMI